MKRSAFPLSLLAVVWIPLFLDRGVAGVPDPLDESIQFLSYGRIPTWTGVAVDWNTDHRRICLYDSHRYRGHAEFVSRALKTAVTFRQFKRKVRDPEIREYLPFFLYDLRHFPYSSGNREYGWAVRLEDYEYQDSDQQMVSTCGKLLESLADTMGRSGGTGSRHGLLIVSENEKVQPHASLSRELSRRGYLTLTLSALLKHAGAKQVSVLNPGMAIGYLRRVEAGKEAEFRFGGDEILIYDVLPPRAPPVSGIITLEPQTPLSHLNLLAINRGTVNLYATSMENLPGAPELMGKLVRLEGLNDRISIGPATESELARSRKKRLEAEITLPSPDPTIRGLVDLGKETSAALDIRAIGAKAANYARIQAWYPRQVRPGFAMPFSAYFEILDRSNAASLIADLLRDKKDLPGSVLEGRLAAIREAIGRSRVPPAALQDLRRFLRDRLPVKRIRLRSSTNCEDLPDFNGAGLYLSKGFNASESDGALEAAILDVHASLWSLPAFAEREYMGLDHSKAAMAILIQEAFQDEFANGVALTVPEGRGGEVLINVRPGGSSVTNPEPGALPEVIRFKDFASDRYAVDSRSNSGPVFEGSDSLQPILQELKGIAVDLHRRLVPEKTAVRQKKYGVDLEFRIMKEAGGCRLYIKQARLLGMAVPVE